IFTAGMPPPMTFAFETSDGHRGVFQFSGYAGGGGRYEVHVRYKQIQQSGDASSSSGGSLFNGDGAQANPQSSQLPESTAATPLAEAITNFNKTAAESPIGKDQPPL